MVNAAVRWSWPRLDADRYAHEHCGAHARAHRKHAHCARIAQALLAYCARTRRAGQDALLRGDAVEVEDPQRPGSRLYTWKVYENTDKTKLRSVLEDDTGAAGFHDNLDLDWGFARTDTARTASSSSQAPLQLTDGKVEVDDAVQLVGFTGAAPQPTTPKTPTNAGKVWAKLNDAIRVGNNIIFRAQLAVRSLGKGQRLRLLQVRW